MTTLLIQSNFALRSIGHVLETVSDPRQILAADVSIAFVIPFWRATPERQKKSLVSHRSMENYFSSHFVSTLAKCIIFDFPPPHGSIKYREASTTPRTLLPPRLEEEVSRGALPWSTEVSTITQAPFGKFVRHDLEWKDQLIIPSCASIPLPLTHLNTQ